jgi:hypothetical protein
MPRVPKSVQKRYRKVIQEVVEDLSDEITILNPSSVVDCPDCYLDELTGKSSNVFDVGFLVPVVVFAGTSSERTITPTPFTRGRCPICFGEGKLEATSVSTIKALIDFFPNEVGFPPGLEYAPYGRDGKVFAILKTHERHYEVLLNSLGIVFRGKRYEVIFPPVFTGVGLDALVSCWIVPIDTDSRVAT